jgi:hypothetical protein
MQNEANLEQHRTLLSPDASCQRTLTQDSVHRMTVIAVRQWEQAARGLLAIPSAIAMTTAASAMLVTSIVERTFEVVELAFVDIGGRVGSDFDAHGERRVVGGRDERRSDVS